MSYGDIEQRPAKKRRFFDPESEPEPEPPSIPTETIAAGTSTSARNRDSRSLTSTQVAKFDRGLIESIVGPVPDETIAVLRDVAGGDTERAINMYLDGSWQTNLPSRAAAQSSSTSSPPENATTPTKSSSPPIILDLTPEHRYIGAFGATAWATRSGSNLVKHGDVVSIERTKMKQVKLGKGGRPIPLSRQRADVIVRFTNVRGEEVGRLQKETAAWVSSLIDQKIIHFEGTCVFAPEKIRVNDTIYLQLRCYLRKSACDGNNLKPLDDNRATGVFEEKESLEEQALRLRQVGSIEIQYTTLANNHIGSDGQTFRGSKPQSSKRKRDHGKAQTRRPTASGRNG